VSESVKTNETIKQRLATLEEGHWLLIVAPAFEHIITGVLRVGVMKNGVVKVMYEDHTVEECADCDALLSEMDADNPSLLALVAHVQDRRKATT
jgi:hypothetical protein